MPCFIVQGLVFEWTVKSNVTYPILTIAQLNRQPNVEVSAVRRGIEARSPTTFSDSVFLRGIATGTRILQGVLTESCCTSLRCVLAWRRRGGHQRACRGGWV